MTEKILVTTTKEKKVDGILYWVKANKEGFLEIWASLLSRGGRPKKKKRKKKVGILEIAKDIKDEDRKTWEEHLEKEKNKE